MTSKLPPESAESSNSISRRFEAPYTATTYAAGEGSGRFAIRVGDPTPDGLLREGEEEWAYITAWNPGSQVRSSEENERAQDELRTALLRQGRRFWEGMSEADDGSPGEGSFLVVIPVEEAARLGRRFAQNAILVGGRDKPARLLWLKDGRVGRMGRMGKSAEKS